jgi:hypothetical protein
MTFAYREVGVIDAGGQTYYRLTGTRRLSQRGGRESDVATPALTR